MAAKAKRLGGAREALLKESDSKKVRSSGFSAFPDSFIVIIFLLVVRGDHLPNQTEQPWT